MKLDGFLLIDKAKGLTSHQVVESLRTIARERSIGHCGTLDPMATGLIVLCLGKATTLSRFFTGLEKEYIGDILLGRRSNTYDIEGEIEVIDENPQFSEEELQCLFKEFIGEQYQIPPPYSAIRVKGKRLYDYARKGEKVDTPKRKVKIYELKSLGFEPPKIKFLAIVSSGTYIRSLAHDIGEQLGCGAVLHSLRRTRIGKFRVNDAFTLEEIMKSSLAIRENLLSIYEACDFLPRVMVDETGLRKLAYGQPFDKNYFLLFDEDTLQEKKEVVVFDKEKNFVAIALADKKKKGNFQFFPRRVLINQKH